MSMTRLIACLLILSFTATAQKDSVTIKYSYGSENPEMQDMYRFMYVDVNSLTIYNNEHKSFYCKLSSKVFRNGVAEKEIVQNDGEALRRYFSCNKADSSITIKAMSRQIGDDSLDVVFFFPRVQVREGMSILKVPNAYSMRMLIETDNSGKATLPLAQKIPFLACISPYVYTDKPGAASYCAVSTSVPPEQWHEKYKLNYYVAFYLELIPIKE